MKKKLLAVFCLFGLIASLSALDLSLRLTPTLMFPSHEYLDKEFGSTFQADFNIFNLVTLGLDGAFLTVTPEGLSSGINFASLGAGLGLFYTPVSRLYLGAGLAGGLYTLSYEIDSTPYSFTDLYVRAYGELGFRINPNLTVYGNGGYTCYFIKDSQPLNKGPFAGIGLKTDLSGMTWELLGFAVAFVIIGCISKIIGCGGISKCLGYTWKESYQIGLGMMVRGEVALIVATKGLSSDLIDTKYFTAVILLIIVSSMLVPILLKRAFMGNEKIPEPVPTEVKASE